MRIAMGVVLAFLWLGFKAQVQVEDMGEPWPYIVEVTGILLGLYGFLTLLHLGGWLDS